MIEPRRDVPAVRHGLAIALQFEDIFTGEPVRAPLQVSIPELRWKAVRGGDGTYRFVSGISQPPPGSYEVEVVSPTGEYRSFVPLQITLPHAGPTPPTRLGWMVTRPLWPTRKLRIGPNDTGLTGRLVTAGVPQPLRKIRFVGSMAPVDPYTFSDEHGELIARFPHARRDPIGPTPVLTLALTIELDDGAATVSPGAVTIDLGTIRYQQFDVS